MKRFTFIFIIFISLFSCNEKSNTKSSLIDYIPNSPSIVISAPNISFLQNELKENSFINKFNTTTSYQNLKKEFQFCSEIKSDNAILISYATVGKNLEFLFSIKTKNTENNISVNSVKENYNNTSYQKLKNQEAFTVILDSTLVVTSSEILLENLIRNKKDNIKYSNKSLLKLHKTSDSEKVTAFINNDKKPEVFSSIFPSQFIGITDWLSIELNNSNGIVLNGIGTNTEVNHDFASKILTTTTEKSSTSSIIPANFNEYTSYSFEEIKTLNSKYEHFNELIDNCSEVVSFNDDKNSLGAFKLLNTEVSDNITEHSTYRNNIIYKNSYFKIPAVICNPQPEFACYLDDFLIFSNSIESLQNCISHYQNKTTLKNQFYFKENNNALLKEVHITKSTKSEILKNKLATILDDKSITTIKLNDFPLVMHQITYEGNYIQFNSVAKKITKQKANEAISQVGSVTLDANLNSNIQWVTNHRTKQKELIVQDENNVLYLISNKGTILWKKQLSGKIKGKVKQIDLYKNRKLQMAFTTDNEFLVLDRNGKIVDQFHKKFKKGNLLPLSVFDYDNNRNYRFLITQNDRLYMYDNKFKLVKGFSFKKVKSSVSQSPMHIRLGTKDYIVVSEENGKIHILNRQGKSRTKIKDKFNFSNTEIVNHKNLLVFKDYKNVLHSINIANGKVSKLDILQGNNSSFNYKNDIKVKLEDNNLTIKNNTIELDFGNYTTPEVFYQNKKYYISLTDIDTQKVYMYDSRGKLLDNFPVYGQSSIDLTNMDQDSKLEFSVKGEQNSVLIYKMY